MKKATLEFFEGEGFVLMDEENLIICKVDAGSNPEEADWQLIEQQANKIGYTLY